MLSGQVLDLTEIQSLSNLQQLDLALGSKLHGLKVYIEPISWITKHPVVAGWAHFTIIKTHLDGQVLQTQGPGPCL